MKRERLWLAPILALMALVGCTLTRADRRKDGDDKAMVIGGKGAGSVATKQATLVIRIASRPVEDQALGSVIWDAADELMISAELRKLLDANGLRLGVLSGELPRELRAVLDAPPPKRIDPMTVVLPDGESTVVDLASAPNRSLALNLPGGKVVSKSYDDLHGFFRLTAKLDDSGGVALRLVPELHHGPIRRNFTPGPTLGSMEPMQFVIRDGQEEETITDLRADVVLRPGQVAVISGLPDKTGGLGEFLFAAVEANSDRRVRRAVFLSATRSDLGSAPPGPRAAPPRLVPAEPPEETANPPGR